MHETHLLKHIFAYLADQERIRARKILGICVAVSEFGGISRRHFLEHYRQESAGTRWESLDIEIKDVPCGPELEITRIDFGFPPASRRSRGKPGAGVRGND